MSATAGALVKGGVFAPAAGREDAGGAMTTERSVLCPACGYDLRGATEDRCSECGLVVDLASLQHSEIPWAYRRQIGWGRAFFKTVWMITSDVKSLRHEAAKPQSP